MGMEKLLERDWVDLMIQAKQMGIPIEEIRKFLQQKSVKTVTQMGSKQ